MHYLMSSTLFGSDDEEIPLKGIKVNQKYAREYQSRKEKEELRQVQFEGVDNEEDDATSESEDEDAELLTTKIDVNIVKTINALRTKDSRIYDKSIQFFHGSSSDEEDEAGEGKKHSKPKRYKDVMREQILEQIDEQESNTNELHSRRKEKEVSRFEYDDEQKKLREAFLTSTGDDESTSDDEKINDEFMIIKKRKSSGDGVTAGAERELDDEMKKLETSMDKSGSDLVDPKGEVKDGDKFLLDFFKKRSWIDREEENTSDDEKNDKDTKVTNSGYASDESLKELEKADDFESSFNFRFEQAASKSTSGADYSMIGYARGQTMNTLRRPDERRREKRQQQKERKLAERKAKEEQLKRLKKAKRSELTEKFRQVKMVLGEAEGNEDSIDETAVMKLLEGDFDPEKFESVMKEAYNDDFYQQEDKHWKTDKDVRDDLRKDEDGDLITGEEDPDAGLYDNVEEEADFDDHDLEKEYDEEDWMDDDNDDQAEEETELEKKVKSKLEEELYKLDYEDIVAGMPTRFKYRQVEANSFGLSTEEILMARDANLKQFVSLKKMAPYNEHGEHFVGSKKRRRFREALKKDLEEDLAAFGSPLQPTNEDGNNGEEEGEKDKKKRRRLKKKKKEKPEDPGNADETNVANLDTNDDSVLRKSKKRRRKKKATEKVDQEPEKVDDATDKGEQLTEAEAPNVEKKLDKDKREAKDNKKRKKKKSKKMGIEGLSESRLASYGL